jgi:hypothetical protein
MLNSIHCNKIRSLILLLILIAASSRVVASVIVAGDSLTDKKEVPQTERVIRGERLFYGLVYPAGQSVNCSGCHNTREADTLNWNPDALEISKKYLNKTAADLGRVLLKPSGAKMVQVHKDIHLASLEIEMVKAYMDRFTETGLKPDKPVITNLFLFVVATILFLFSILDLTVIKLLKRSWINHIIWITTGAFLTYLLAVNAIAIGRSRNYSPTQPVKFSHAVHAGQNGTDCIYCHSYAQVSKSAGIPAENVCMNCHLIVRNGKRSGSFEIAKIIDSYENRKPIRWIKIHNLPDHVFFSHAQHVTAGKVDCTECHGDIKTMDRVRQVSDLSMGWCINCHRTRKVDFHDNSYYSQYRNLARKLGNGEINGVTVSMTGGTECMKCHY